LKLVSNKAGSHQLCSFLTQAACIREIDITIDVPQTYSARTRVSGAQFEIFQKKMFITAKNKKYQYKAGR
jgi:hypothetical protein